MMHMAAVQKFYQQGSSYIFRVELGVENSKFCTVHLIMLH